MPLGYYNIGSLKRKKTYFINHIYKIVAAENMTIMKEREFIKYMYIKRGILDFDFTELSFSKLQFLQDKYRVRGIFDYEDFLLKVDMVPPALAIAQAIVESGWGESRFVHEANNFFGQWTYFGDGVIPIYRNDGATHRIKIFETVEDSVYNYLLNINIGWGYKKLRKERLELRKLKKSPNSMILVGALKNYSEVGQAYIRVIKEVMKHNNLYFYDEKFYKSLKPIGFNKFSLGISD